MERGGRGGREGRGGNVTEYSVDGKLSAVNAAWFRTWPASVCEKCKSHLML